MLGSCNCALLALREISAWIRWFGKFMKVFHEKARPSFAAALKFYVVKRLQKFFLRQTLWGLCILRQKPHSIGWQSAAELKGRMMDWYHSNQRGCEASNIVLTYDSDIPTEPCLTSKEGRNKKEHIPHSASLRSVNFVATRVVNGSMNATKLIPMISMVKSKLLLKEWELRE